MDPAIARFIPAPDARERHAVLVRAPADLVFEVAEAFDLQSIRPVRVIFWLREKLLRARPGPPRTPRGLVDEMTSIGWGVLAREPGRLLVAGAETQPWQADVIFRPIPPERFAAFAEPNRVKIAWTIEAEPLGPDRARLATETRAVATDAGARRKFRRYWRTFGIGIVLIRWFLLPAVRREAERRFRPADGAPAARAR